MKTAQRVNWVGPACAVACMAAIGARPALAAEKPPIVARAEACLHQNVERIVSIESDIQSAARFLVEFTCAAEVGGVSKYERNLSYLQAVTSMVKAVPQTGPNPVMSFEVKASVDPNTGDFVIPEPKPGERTNPMQAMLPQMSTASTQMMPDVAPMAMRKLAGELVLAARERRQGITAAPR